MKVDKSAAIRPGASLGGLMLGAHLQEYFELLFDEYTTRMTSNPDARRFTASPFETLNFFEARWHVPPVAVYADVRDGIVFKLGGSWGYQGSLKGHKVGTTMGEAMARDPALEWDHGAEALIHPDGAALLQAESDPPDEMIPHLVIEEIAVYLPTRGLTPTLNLWPPATQSRGAGGH